MAWAPSWALDFEEPGASSGGDCCFPDWGACCGPAGSGTGSPPIDFEWRGPCTVPALRSRSSTLWWHARGATCCAFRDLLR